MAKVPTLQVSGLPAASQEETSATASPARGREMRQTLLSKLRSPPLTHSWDLWHDRQSRTAPSTQPTNAAPSGADDASKYEDRLKHMCSISDVKAFWSTFNNLEMSGMPQNDSIHLFHKGVKPVWEDPRNMRGGCWTFRVQKDKAKAFWTEICMMAIGEKLQDAVASNRPSFNDDICGVSYSVRFASILIQIWNRDAGHAEGIANLLDTVQGQLPPELKPRDGSFYYKAHSEHAGFNQPPALLVAGASKTTTGAGAVGTQVRPPGPTMPPNLPSDPSASTSGDLKAAESKGGAHVNISQLPPGTYPTSQTTPGSGIKQHAEVMQEVEDSLGAMKTAMDIVGQKPVDHDMAKQQDT